MLDTTVVVSHFGNVSGVYERIRFVDKRLDFWKAAIRPLWRWLVMVPLAILGVLQLARDEFLPPEEQIKYHLTEVLSIAPQWPVDRYILIGFVLAIILSFEGAFRFHRKTMTTMKIKLDERHGRRFGDFQAEHDELRSARKKYWETLDDAFHRWRANVIGAPATLRELAKNAGYLQDLPLSEGNNIGEWCHGRIQTAYGSEKLMWQFAIAIYPENMAENSTHMTKEEHQTFDTCQGQLSNFWQKVGWWIFYEQSLSDNAITDGRYFPSQYSLMLILIYLECALAHRLESRGAGKTYLYQVGKFVTEKGMI